MSSSEWEGPYSGPPRYGQPQYGQPQYGQPQYGQPQYGTPGYPPYGAPGYPPYGAPGYPPPGWGGHPLPPGGPQRPGSVIAAAVVAFATAGFVLIGTLYAAAFGALLSLARGPGSGLGGWVALLHVALAGLLVVGGVRVLDRDRWWLVGAVAAQLVLSVYWFVVLDDIAGSAFQDSARIVPSLYVVLALVAGGLTFLPDARAWSARPAPAPAGGPPAAG